MRPYLLRIAIIKLWRKVAPPLKKVSIRACRICGLRPPSAWNITSAQTSSLRVTKDLMKTAITAKDIVVTLWAWVNTSEVEEVCKKDLTLKPRTTPSKTSTRIAYHNRYLPQVGKADFWRTKHPSTNSRSPSRSHRIRSLYIRPKTSMLTLTTMWLIIKVTPALKSSQATPINNRTQDRRRQQLSNRRPRSSIRPTMLKFSSSRHLLEVIQKVISLLLAMSRTSIHTLIPYTQTMEMQAIISAKTLRSIVGVSRKTHKIHQETNYIMPSQKRHQHMILLRQNMEAAQYWHQTNKTSQIRPQILALSREVRRIYQRIRCEGAANWNRLVASSTAQSLTRLRLFTLHSNWVIIRNLLAVHLKIRLYNMPKRKKLSIWAATPHLHKLT